MAIRKQVSSDKALPQGRQRNYNDIVAYLDQRWEHTRSLARAKKLDLALGSPSKQVKTILIAGTNGKSTTTELASSLLTTEGLNVGSCTSPHIIAYNERITFNGTSITNSLFTEVANEVINTAEEHNIDAHSLELLTVMALKFFAQKKVDVVLLEVIGTGDEAIAHIGTPLVAAVTRVTADEPNEELIPLVDTIMAGLIEKNTWMVSGDQNKANLARMEALTKQMKGNWAMPIRKMAPLPYPFEQIHGRCGSLAERIAQLYVDNFFNKGVTITTDSLLSRKKTSRGRPTTEAKRKAELHPVKSLAQFWRETKLQKSGRFEMLTKERPPIVLDTASNIDALKNVLLGLRLLNYDRHFKGCALVIAAAEETLNNAEFLKLMRYFFRKISGSVIICPLNNPVPGSLEQGSWDVEKVTNAIKSLRVRAYAAKNIEEALRIAQENVDPKDGLICITGSRSVVSAYWKTKN